MRGHRTASITTHTMKINIRVKLMAHTQGHPITITELGGSERILARDGEFTVEVDRDYEEHMEHMDLFRITAMREGIYQRIAIRGVSFNGVDLQDWREFCRFHVTGNRWQEDAIQQPCWELGFHGVFQLRMAHRRAQWHWTQDYHSSHRSDFVSDNQRWDCDDTHHCDGGVQCQSRDGPHHHRWLNIPHAQDYHPGDHYEYGAFGCSITQGMALPKGTEWPALVARTHTVCNLATPGAGIDSVFLNLQHGLARFNIDRVVVVLPSYSRRLLRFQSHGTHHRVPVCLGTAEWPMATPSLWYHPQELAQRKREIQDGLGREPDLQERRGRRIIGRMLALLAITDRPHWITSWNEDVYRDLKGMVAPDHLLDRFPMDHQARDLRHTSEQAHERWLDGAWPHLKP